MHVGYAPLFQNPGNARSDAEVYVQELRLAEMAEPLGFDSVWSVEHHFTNYTMCPDVLQFLSYMAGKTQRVKLGSMVVVLPWHDPVRVAEQIVMLDHLSGGRVILGLGRGLARVEYEGFRIDQNEGRQRFVEYAELVLRGWSRATSRAARRCGSRAATCGHIRCARSAAAPTRPRCRPSRCLSWRVSASACW
jgi:alkanesulfonate monooxygenase SsuD/methylene tetrahydromethanopterin reductase-like flavin-dependent oxidoreductase (luciferase family)